MHTGWPGRTGRVGAQEGGPLGRKDVLKGHKSRRRSCVKRRSSRVSLTGGGSGKEDWRSRWGPASSCRSSRRFSSPPAPPAPPWPVPNHQGRCLLPLHSPRLLRLAWVATLGSWRPFGSGRWLLLSTQSRSLQVSVHGPVPVNEAGNARREMREIKTMWHSTSRTAFLSISYDITGQWRDVPKGSTMLRLLRLKL